MAGQPATPASAMTIAQALRQATTQLHESHSASLDAELLLAHVLACPRTTLHAWPQRPLSTEQQDYFHDLLSRRVNGAPIAYLLGQREFWSLRLKVTPDTLIPRPDTERLIELALERIPTDAQWSLADLGTGSGAIALALASERSYCQVSATDNSVAALAVAQENAETLALHNVRFVQGDWFAPLAQQRFHLIASNPPYVAHHDPHLQQGDLRFEPQQALIADDDGLTALHKIIQQGPDHLTSGGWLLLEHGFEQGDAVCTLLRQRGFDEVATYQDYAGLDRISLGRWSG